MSFWIWGTDGDSLRATVSSLSSKGSNVALCGSVAEWLERRVRDQEVAGSSVTHSAAEYGPGQGTRAHLPVIKQYNLLLDKG